MKEITLEEAGNRLTYFFLLLKRHLIMIMAVNLLFIFCSLPIITVIPAFGALQYSFYCLYNEDSALIGNFFKGFGKNMIKYWKVSLGLFLTVVLVLLAFWFYAKNDMLLPAVLLAAGTLFLIMMAIYGYPVCYEEGGCIPKDVIKKSCCLVLLSFLPIFIFIVFFIFGIRLVLGNPYLVVILTTVYFSIMAMITVFMYSYYREQMEKLKNKAGEVL